MTTIAATPDDVFPHLNSLQKVAEWSPWSQIDPAMKVSYSGPEVGVGNKMAWVSEMREVGSGTQEIVDSIVNERVTTALDFGDMGTANAAFLLAVDDGKTLLEWNFRTDLGINPVARWMGLGMESWIGGDYEKGLAALKASVEGN